MHSQAIQLREAAFDLHGLWRSRCCAYNADDASDDDETSNEFKHGGSIDHERRCY